MAAANLPVHRDRPGIGPIALSRLVLCEALAAAALLSWYLPSPTPQIVTATCVVMIIAVLAALGAVLSGIYGCAGSVRAPSRWTPPTTR